MIETNKIYQGDCLEIMKTLPDESVDAIVCDPPAGISFMGKEWDTFDHSMFGKQGEEGENDLKNKKNFKILPRYANSDLIGFQNFICQVFTEAKRVLKSGGHLLVWAIPRTSHHTAMGLERAGLEIRDCVYHVFGSGFPKSLNIGKTIDKLQGNERKKLGFKKGQGNIPNDRGKWGLKPNQYIILDKGSSEYEGWGTALKPAVECWWLARKPLSEKTVAENVLKHGTGGINIDECRIKHDEPEKITNRTPRTKENIFSDDSCGFKKETNHIASASQQGRFTSNIIFDEEAGQILDEQSGLVGGDSRTSKSTYDKGIWGNAKAVESNSLYNDKGGASRFFYCAKPSKSERNIGCEDLEEKNLRYEDGSSNSLEIFSNQYTQNSDNPTGRGITPNHKNNHPTVKPVSLMRYLCRLITPKNGIILDPFAGSGSTLIGAKFEGFRYIGIEKEAEYVKIAEARLNINYYIDSDTDKPVYLDKSQQNLNTNYPDWEETLKVN